jgi:DNA-directed RNA polymerase specialized sigma24 family protein
MTRRRDARKPERRLPPDDIANPTQSEAVVEVLPSLRRYAGALTGSTDSGDRYVRQFLKVLLSAPNVLGPDGDTKLQCFVLFHEVCCGLDPAKDAMAPAGADWVDRRLASLLPISRELLLLVHLEGFTAAQAARIVGIAQSEANYHLLNARLAFPRSAPAFWLPAITRKISRFVTDLRSDDDAVCDGNQLQQEAWHAARLTMSRSSWPPGAPRAPRGSLQRDAPPDLDDQPGQRQGLLAPGRARTRDSEGGRMQQREALEVWETEGGAAAPGKML